MGSRAWGIFALAGMTSAYFLVFCLYIALGFIQLHARPFRDLRTAIVLFQLQVPAAPAPACSVEMPTGLMWYPGLDPLSPASMVSGFKALGRVTCSGQHRQDLSLHDLQASDLALDDAMQWVCIWG